MYNTLQEIKKLAQFEEFSQLYNKLEKDGKPYLENMDIKQQFEEFSKFLTIRDFYSKSKKQQDVILKGEKINLNEMIESIEKASESEDARKGLKYIKENFIPSVEKLIEEELEKEKALANKNLKTKKP